MHQPILSDLDLEGTRIAPDHAARAAGQTLSNQDHVADTPQNRVVRRMVGQNRPGRGKPHPRTRFDAAREHVHLITDPQITLCMHDHIARALDGDHTGGCDIDVVEHLQRDAQHLAAVLHPLTGLECRDAIGRAQQGKAFRCQFARLNLAPGLAKEKTIG